MKCIVYISTATNLMADSELARLLQQSRINNEMQNLTGMLLYSQGTFIQVLEGEEADVDFAFKKIEADKRHHGVILLFSDNLTERNFPDWSMGFRTIKSQELSDLRGYFNPDSIKLADDAEKSTHASIEAIKSFLAVNQA